MIVLHLLVEAWLLLGLLLSEHQIQEMENASAESPRCNLHLASVFARL